MAEDSRSDSSGLGEKRGRGGARPGAGRPAGAKNALPQGSVKAIKAANLRVPKDASPAEREAANHALERIVDVMDERVSSFQAFAVLQAARIVREDICGKVAEKHEHSGTITHAHLVAEAAK